MNLDTVLQEVRSIFDSDDRPDHAGYVSAEVAAEQYVASLSIDLLWDVFRQACSHPVIKAEGGSVTISASMLVDMPAAVLKRMLAQLLRCDAKLCQLEEERHQHARYLNMTPKLVPGPDGSMSVVYQARAVAKHVDDASFWGRRRAQQAQLASR